MILKNGILSSLLTYLCHALTTLRTIIIIDAPTVGSHAKGIQKSSK